LREESLLQSFFLCENYQRHSCKASIGLSIRAKMIGRGRPLLRKNLADTEPTLAKHGFSIFSRRNTYKKLN